MLRSGPLRGALLICQSVALLLGLSSCESEFTTDLDGSGCVTSADCAAGYECTEQLCTRDVGSIEQPAGSPDGQGGAGSTSARAGAGSGSVKGGTSNQGGTKSTGGASNGGASNPGAGSHSGGNGSAGSTGSAGNPGGSNPGGSTSGGSTSDGGSSPGTAGTGGSGCAEGEALCSDLCVDLKDDPTHCGSCETQCSAPTNATAVCVSSRCNFVCQDGFMPCGDRCSDPKSDVANCGGCGNVCPAKQECVEGACKTDCVGLGCGLPCLGAKTRCGNECVDLNKDGKHCGACDNKCDKGGCKAGACDQPNED